MIKIKKKFCFYNFAEHLQKARGTSVKNQWSTSWEKVELWRIFFTIFATFEVMNKTSNDISIEKRMNEPRVTPGIN